MFTSSEFNFNTANDKTIYPFFSLKAGKQGQNLIIDDQVYSNHLGLQISNKKELKGLIDEGKLRKKRTLSKNEFAENILKRIPPFNSFSVDNFKLVFDLILKIHEHSMNEKKKNNGVIESKTIQQGVCIETYSDHQDLNIFLSMTKNQLQKHRNKSWCNGINIFEGKIEITTGILEDPICIQIGITPDIISFLRKKKQSHNNRIYVHFMTENGEYVCSYEILSGEAGDFALINLMPII